MRVYACTRPVVLRLAGGVFRRRLRISPAVFHLLSRRSTIGDRLASGRTTTTADCTRWYSIVYALNTHTHTPGHDLLVEIDILGGVLLAQRDICAG